MPSIRNRPAPSVVAPSGGSNARTATRVGSLITRRTRTWTPSRGWPDASSSRPATDAVGSRRTSIGPDSLTSTRTVLPRWRPAWRKISVRASKGSRLSPYAVNRDPSSGLKVNRFENW